MAGLPIACALSPDDLRAGRDGLLPGLVARAFERASLPDGRRWRFETADTLISMTEVIDAERRCCLFLRFAITAPPELGPITLDVTGPPGTVEFLDALGGPRARCSDSTIRPLKGVG